jgi:hypothetical protein
LAAGSDPTPCFSEKQVFQTVQSLSLAKHVSQARGEG